MLVFVLLLFGVQAGTFDDHMGLGQYYLDRNDCGRAVSEFEAAAQMKPDSEIAQYNLGVALRLWGDPEGAEKALREALRLRPHFPQAHFVLGLVRGDRVGSENLGLEEFAAAIAQNPSFGEAHFNIGIITGSGTRSPAQWGPSTKPPKRTRIRRYSAFDLLKRWPAKEGLPK